MHESRRRAYLEAMGVVLWERRPRRDALGSCADRPEMRLPPGSPGREGARGQGPAAVCSAALPPTPLRESDDAPEEVPVRSLDWDGLQARVAACRRCPELVANRTQTVFGVGKRTAAWMVIGEAPGVDEDRQGEPFVGRAGQLLNAMLGAAGLAREAVFIANVLKCRPPGNRDPRPDEAQRCASFLRRQIELVAPRLMLVVGRVAAQSLLETEEPVGRLRGRVHRFGEQRIPLVVTYHPAYLLRSPEQKGKAWQDLLLALAAAEEPPV